LIDKYLSEECLVFNLQKALDERLATLKNKKGASERAVASTYSSKESIVKSLKQAGILNKNGKMIIRNAA
jgi:hypothetical protein